MNFNYQTMLIQVHTDNNIEGKLSRNEYFETVIENALKRYADQITRVQVHLGDENAGKQGDNDKRCMIEVRLKGHEPVAITNHANSIQQALTGGLDKLKNALEHSIGRLQHH